MFLLGLGIGYGTRPSTTTMSLVHRMAFLVVLILLFVLGNIVGKNDLVFEKLPDLGALSLAISWGSILGSVFVAGIVCRLGYGNRE